MSKYRPICGSSCICLHLVGSQRTHGPQLFGDVCRQELFSELDGLVLVYWYQVYRVLGWVLVLENSSVACAVEHTTCFVLEIQPYYNVLRNVTRTCASQKRPECESQQESHALLQTTSACILLRNLVRKSFSTTIQRIWRGYWKRKRYRALRRSAILVQAFRGRASIFYSRFCNMSEILGCPIGQLQVHSSSPTVFYNSACLH